MGGTADPVHHLGRFGWHPWPAWFGRGLSSYWWVSYRRMDRPCLVGAVSLDGMVGSWSPKAAGYHSRQNPTRSSMIVSLNNRACGTT